MPRKELSFEVSATEPERHMMTSPHLLHLLLEDLELESLVELVLLVLPQLLQVPLGDLHRLQPVQDLGNSGASGPCRFPLALEQGKDLRRWNKGVRALHMAQINSSKMVLSKRSLVKAAKYY